ncbi:MAG: hypothetical protein HYY10_04310 [Candidatus Liptonbacteria bacterium]|nr:hypothetical protein [Candidatus Liptonbacteria bacterium]
MPRFLKQFLYGLLYLAIFVGIPVGIYLALLKPSPTCWDAAQNGREQGIDCGGNCPQVCIPATIRPLQALDGAKIIPVDASHASMLVEVTNANVDYGAPQFGYAVTFTDESGATSTLSGVSYIYGGEVRNLAFPNLDISGDSIRDVSVAFSVPQWVPTDAWKQPSLRVQHAATERKDEQLVVSGELVNDDTVAFSSVEVVVLFKGRFGETVGVSRTAIEGVAPADARTFTVFHPDVASADLSATSVALAAFRP